METYTSSKIQSWLSWFLRGMLLLAFLILSARLIDLQVIRGGYFRDISEGNRIRRVPIEAERGKIVARGGELLAENKYKNKKIEFLPEKGYEKVDIDSEDSDARIIKEPVRFYPLGKAAGHITGYVGETTSDEVGKIDAQCPEKGPRKLGGHVGRSGLEQQYDCLLRGIDGEELIEVDSAGNMIRLLGRRDPVNGSDVRVNINYFLQERISTLLEGQNGVIIVTDPLSEVLALFSSPSYDPNIFVESDDSRAIEEILTSAQKPLFNRSIGGIYPPGSVIKPVLAASALESGIIDDDYLYTDTGSITINTSYGEFSYNNWYFTQYGGTEGEIGVERSIARSTDTFFYKVGEMMGIDNIVKWFETFGLDGNSGIDLPGDIPGLVPSPDWKQKVKGERWFLGNTYHISIGQGDLAVTPMAINRAIATLSNKGELCDPRFLKGLENNCTEIGLESEPIELVVNGMVQACSDGGTGFTFFDINLEDVDQTRKVACKTGTAETTDTKDPHAWFTFFAPVKDPEIVVTILVENGGEGSRVAGPIAREVYDLWFTE
jgi:penicillin-binding protein 2